MGLSGNTRKVKIPDDPRNTKWSTDTSAPGFRLLSSMGWTPGTPGLGLAASQDLITAGGSRAFSKKITAIPIAKSDNLGIGARGGAGIGSIRAMGTPAIGGMGMGFVTASITSTETVQTEGKPASGGEFGRLLERLNAASSQSASPAPEPEEVVEVVAVSDEKAAKAARKLEKAARKIAKQEKRDKKERKRNGVAEPVATPVEEVVTPLSTILKNPRMAARSKHLRSKRMAASNATAMAEILGIAPTPSPSASGSSSPAISHQGISSGSIPPVAFVRPDPNPISHALTDSFPIAPPRVFPTFASSSHTLAATFVQEAVVVVETVETVTVIEGETEKEKVKREKKELKRKAKETKVEVPILSKVFSMFAASSTGGLASTIVAAPVVTETKRAREEDDEAVEVDEEERKRAKKARKEEKKLAKGAK